MDKAAAAAPFDQEGKTSPSRGSPQPLDIYLRRYDDEHAEHQRNEEPAVRSAMTAPFVRRRAANHKWRQRSERAAQHAVDADLHGRYSAAMTSTGCEVPTDNNIPVIKQQHGDCDHCNQRENRSGRRVLWVLHVGLGTPASARRCHITRNCGETAYRGERATALPARHATGEQLPWGRSTTIQPRPARRSNSRVAPTIRSSHPL